MSCQWVIIEQIPEFSRPERPVFNVSPLREPLAPLVPLDIPVGFPLLSYSFL